MNTITTTQLTESNESNKIVTFIENHIPALESGDYEMKLTQKTEGEGEGGSVKDDKPTTTQLFSVQGERFTLNTAQVYSCFPAKNHHGDFSNCLPHIVFRSVSLPWQRDLGDADPDKKTSWLALLAFRANEVPKQKQVTIGSFTQDQLPDDASNVLFYPFTQESSEQKDDPCQIIDIPIDLFNQLAPSVEELKYLAHVREVDTLNKATPSAVHPVYAYQSTEASSQANFSVVIGSRLLARNGQYTAHLISLENMGNYLPDSEGTPSTQIAGKTYVRLVSLYKWNFSIVKENKHLSDIVRDLNNNYTDPITLKLPQITDTSQPGASTLNVAADMGYMPMKHTLRAGGETVSWYRGPLAPYGVNDNTVAWPQQSADALLRYNPNTGLFDLSYAAAWQLGRLLGLQNKKFAETLYQWKQQNKQATIQDLEQEILNTNLNLSTNLATQPTNRSAIRLSDGARAKIKTFFKNYLQKNPTKQP